MIKGLFGAVFLLLLLQACFMQPVNLPEIHKYQLTGNLSCVKRLQMSHTRQTLFVAMPHAISPYNYTQMVYSQNPCEIGYFAENRWVTPLPQMLLPLIVQAMRNTGCFKTVVGFPTMANTNYRLETSLVMLRQEFCRRKSQVHIVLDANLIRSSTQKVIATQRIDVCVPTTCPTPASGVCAYQIALNKVLKHLSWFTIDTLGPF